jgi:hypothetical protein
MAEKVFTIHEARQLKSEEIVKGLRVKGLFLEEDGSARDWDRDDKGAPTIVRPFGGSWGYDPKSETLELLETPTRHDPAPRKSEEEKAEEAKPAVVKELPAAEIHPEDKE